MDPTTPILGEFTDQWPTCYERMHIKGVTAMRPKGCQVGRRLPARFRGMSTHVDLSRRDKS
jgi:hypothetical protein